MNKSPAELIVTLTPTKGRTYKSFCRINSGEIERSQVQPGKYFTYQTEPVSSLTELHQLLRPLSEQRDTLLIRGRVRTDVDTDRPIRRRIRQPNKPDPNEHAIEDQPCSWMMIDVDKLALPDGIDVVDNTLEAVYYAVSQLPSEFESASYVWQLSGSCGVFETNKISAHLFFWLSEPALNEHLRQWGKSVNAESGSKIIDIAVFNSAQPHFVANPVFKGLPDPFPSGRLGLVTGETETVALNFDQRVINSRSGTGQSIEGVGYEAKMFHLGDGLGKQGFHNVITSAIAAYVSHVGSEEAERTSEDLKADIRERIAETDQSNHSATEVDNYCADSYLDRSILGAIEKFGMAEELPPHWDTQELTLEEGQARLEEIIDQFGTSAAAFHDNPIMSPPVLAVKATAGLGKTRSVIKQLLAYRLLERGDVHYFVPTHALSAQLLTDLDNELTLKIADQNEGPALETEDTVFKRARVIGGRSQLDGETGQPLCRKHSVANRVAAAGRRVYPLLCKNKEGQCQFFDDCDYLAQLEEPKELPEEMRAVLTEVKVMTHEHLFLGTKAQFLNPSLIVIDESFGKSAYESFEVPVNEVMRFSEPTSLIAKVGELLLREETELLHAVRQLGSSSELLDELGQYDGMQDSSFGAVDIGASEDAQLAAMGNETLSRVPLLIQTLASELQMTDRNISHALKSDGTNVKILRRKELILPNAPVLMIDADANPILLEPLFEQDVKIEEIAVERQAEVHQFKDKTFSRTSLQDGTALLDEVRAFIESIAGGGKTLVVASKRVKELISEGLDESAGATMEHFNNLRGVNKFSDYENVIIVGREQPSSVGVEENARGLWFDADDSLRLLEDKSGSRPFENERRGYRLRNGYASVNVQVHPDYRVQALLEQIRESESTQAIDRLRLLRGHSGGVQRRVFILSSVPLDITVDHLWSWTALQETLGLFKVCNGVVPLNAEHLMAAVQNIGAIATAKRRVAELKSITSLISISIRDLILLKAPYKVTGQKRASTVLFNSCHSAEQVAKRLTEIAGEPVQLGAPQQVTASTHIPKAQ